MIQPERIEQALCFATAQGYFLSESLFISFLGDEDKVCCIIRASAMAGGADSKTVTGLVLGAAGFLGVTEAEIWAFIDGFEDKTTICFEDHSREWFGMPSSWNKKLEKLPFKKVLFKTLFDDFTLGRKFKSRFLREVAAKYLQHEGCNICA